MFLGRADMNIKGDELNDSQSFLIQESFLSRAPEEGGEMFI
jgi:hypothetical protein